MRFGFAGRGAQLLLRIAPRRFRVDHGEALIATIDATCAFARQRGGWPAWARCCALEWWDLARVALATRMGRRTRITAGAFNPRRPHGTKGSAMQALGHDLRLAVRSLLASRAQTMLAVLTLALGIGINTAVFSVLDSILWRPVPFRDAARFVELANFNVARKFTYLGASRQLLLQWRGQADLFDRVETYERSSLLYEDVTGAEMVPGAILTPGLLGMLGVPARLGRTFVDGDGRDGADDRVVVSDRFWRVRLHADPSAVAKRLTIGGRPYTVVGVMPATFRFPSDIEDLWLPYDADQPAATALAPRAAVIFARARGGLAMSALKSEVTSRGGRLNEAAGGPADVSAVAVELDGSADDVTRRSLVVLGGAVGFLLLMVCANVANLGLSRSAGRARDFAVRAALGASRLILLREALVEQLLTGALGALFGLGVAESVIRATVAALPESMTASTLNAIDLDGRALLFAVAIAVATAIAFGLAPALSASRASVTGILGRESRSASGSPFSRRARAALVVTQVGLSIVLLVGAALMTRSFLRLAAVGAGFDTAGLVSLRLGLPAAAYRDPAAQDALAGDVADRLRQLPGVAAVTIGTLPSDTGSVSFGSVELAHVAGEPTAPQIAPLHEVAPAYFSTIGLPLVAGRPFREDEGAEVAIVSEHFAQTYWPGGSAIGGRFRVGAGPWRTIVGVAGEAKSLRTGANSKGFELYYPLGAAADAYRPLARSQAVGAFRTILIRAPDPGAVIARVSASVHEIDPRVIVWKTSLVDHLYADAVARPRVVFLMMAVFAAVGLVLAAAGIYGVLSCLVSQRIREIGIRLAIGATPRDIRRLILGNGFVLTSIGLVAGLTASVALVRVMRSLLFQVDPADPVSMLSVTVLLFGTAMAAAWRPARRAMRVNPVTLLREG
jgi:predicted permease